MVKYDKVFTPQEFLELVMGQCWIVDDDDVCGAIQRILTNNDYRMPKIYPLIQADRAIRHDVVLVDVSGFYNGEWETKYVWIEVVGKVYDAAG